MFDLENAAGTPIYLHAKICIVDDVWMTCGSDNFNRRSWTSDSELTCAVFDQGAEGYPRDHLARELRLQLWSEHLGFAPDDPRLLDADAGLALWKASADALDRWHETVRDSPRPTGQVRRHRIEPVSRLQRLWADPLNSLIVDPDARPRRLRGTSKF